MDNRISVIIPTYERLDDLRKCLQCLTPEKQSIPACEYEVIVSDDSRNDDSRRMLETEFDWVCWNQGPRRGPAANRNHGVSCSSMPWIVFTDDDCLPQPGWLTAFQKNMSDNHSVLEGKTLAEGKRARVDEECPINATGGFLWSCNFAIKRELYNQLGGFDEAFPAAALEDVDFRLRLMKTGNAVKFVDEAIVLHPWRLEKGNEFLRKKAESMIFLFDKHPEMRKKYTPAKRAMTLLRNIAPNLAKDCFRYRFRGAIRSIANRFSLELNIQRQIRHHAQKQDV